MNNYTFYCDYEKKHYKRVTKAQARKAYLNGRSVVLCACNLRPFSAWRPEVNINGTRDADFVADNIGLVNRFKELINSFEFYNCINTETGLYTAFYLPID